jgi:hypothetical protein
MYFNAGRVNGFDFYESSAISFLGSYLWEYTGEKHHPAYNDVVNTAVGGMAFGEVTYRLSSMVLDNTATGSGRAWRELGGLVLDPVRGLNRVITGEAFAVHANPADRIPPNYGALFRGGIRTLGENRLWNEAVGRAFIGIEGRYGDRYADFAKPYDHFDFGIQLNFSNRPHGIGQIYLSGVLGGLKVKSAEGSKQVLAAYQDFDYIDNEAYTYGGQSVGVGYRTQIQAGPRTTVSTMLRASGILLGATKSDYVSVSGRDYDYGPGLGFRFGANLGRDGRDVFAVSHASYWVHALSGNDVESYVTFTTVRLAVPLVAYLGFGADYVLSAAHREYAIYPDVDTRNPELRTYFSWYLD